MEEGNDRGGDNHWIYGWPSRAEWNAAGRPEKITVTREDMKRDVARERETGDWRR